MLPFPVDAAWVTGPPLAETFDRPRRPTGKRMTSLVLQVAPPNGSTALAMICTSPLEMRTFLRAFAEKNPTHSPLGDQNGVEAPSDPVSGCCEPASNDRSHNCLLPSSF